MLDLGSTYLFVKDMGESIEFYKKLLGMERTARAYDRWRNLILKENVSLCTIIDLIEKG